MQKSVREAGHSEAASKDYLAIINQKFDAAVKNCVPQVEPLDQFVHKGHAIPDRPFVESAGFFKSRFGVEALPPYDFLQGWVESGRIPKNEVRKQLHVMFPEYNERQIGLLETSIYLNATQTPTGSIVLRRYEANSNQQSLPQEGDGLITKRINSKFDRLGEQTFSEIFDEIRSGFDLQKRIKDTMEKAMDIYRRKQTPTLWDLNRNQWDQYFESEIKEHLKHWFTTGCHQVNGSIGDEYFRYLEPYKLSSHTQPQEFIQQLLNGLDDEGCLAHDKALYLEHLNELLEQFRKDPEMQGVWRFATPEDQRNEFLINWLSLVPDVVKHLNRTPIAMDTITHRLEDEKNPESLFSKAMNSIGIPQEKRDEYSKTLEKMYDEMDCDLKYGLTSDEFKLLYLEEERQVATMTIWDLHIDDWDGKATPVATLQSHIARHPRTVDDLSLWHGLRDMMEVTDLEARYNPDTQLAQRAGEIVDEKTYELYEKRLRERNGDIEATVAERAHQDLKSLIASVGKETTASGFFYRLTGDNAVGRGDMVADSLKHYLTIINKISQEERTALPKDDFFEWTKKNIGWTPRLDTGFDAGEAINKIHAMSPDRLILHSLHKIGIQEKDWQSYLEYALGSMAGWFAFAGYFEKHGAGQAVNVKSVLSLYLYLDAVSFEHECRKQGWIKKGQEMSLLWQVEQYFKKNWGEFYFRYTSGEQMPDYLLGYDLHDWQSRNPPEFVDQLTLKKEEALRHLSGIRYEITHQKPYLDAKRTIRELYPLFDVYKAQGLNIDEIRTGVRQGFVNLEEDLHVILQLGGIERRNILRKAAEKAYVQSIVDAMRANKIALSQKETEGIDAKVTLITCMDDRIMPWASRFIELMKQRGIDVEKVGTAGHFNLSSEILREIISREGWVREVEQKVVTEGFKDVLSGAKTAFDIWHDLAHNPVYFSILMPVIGPVKAADLALQTLTPALRKRIYTFLEEAQSQKAKYVQSADPEIVSAKGAVVLEQLQMMGYIKLEDGKWKTVKRFFPLTVFQGHGSDSENNPLERAHGCGANNGKNGDLPAEYMCRWLNNEDVRGFLKEQGVEVGDAFFLATYLNTAKNRTYYLNDDELPGHEKLINQFNAYKEQADKADKLVAYWRMGNLPGMPHQSHDSPEAAQAYSETLSSTIWAASPEEGHCGVACGRFGTERLTQSLDVEGRMLTVSYNWSDDPQGFLLERQLQAYMKVMRGIMREYYLSKVDPGGVFSGGHKASWNTIGDFTITTGMSFPKLGLPIQMTYRHEPMLPIFLLEAPVEVVESIIRRNPEMAQLIRNGQETWIVCDPLQDKFVEVALSDEGRFVYLDLEEISQRADYPKWMDIKPITERMAIEEASGEKTGFIPWLLEAT